MARRKTTYKETYKKGVLANKTDVLNCINKSDEIELLNMGKFDDGKEFLTVTIIV